MDDPGWRKIARACAPAEARRRGGAEQAAKFRGASLAHRPSVRATRKLKALNRDFRGKDKPTNVLSFPAAPNHDGYRGDIALAYGVTRREAEAGGQELRRSCQPIWWCMACCIWPATIMNAPATPR